MNTLPVVPQTTPSEGAAHESPAVDLNQSSSAALAPAASDLRIAAKTAAVQSNLDRLASSLEQEQADLEATLKEQLAVTEREFNHTQPKS